MIDATSFLACRAEGFVFFPAFPAPIWTPLINRVIDDRPTAMSCSQRGRGCRHQRGAGWPGGRGVMCQNSGLGKRGEPGSPISTCHFGFHLACSYPGAAAGSLRTNRRTS